jgi:glycine oxidase
VRVTVLDDARAGAASAAAAGILGAQAEMHAPGPLFDFALKARALHAALAESLGEDVGYRAWGVLARGADYGWQRAFGQRAERLGAEWFLPDDAQVDPPLLLAAVRRAAKVTCVNATVRAIEGTTVVTDTARITAQQIVVTTGAWASALVPQVAVEPVHGVLCEVAGSSEPQPVCFAPHAYRVTRGDGRVLLGYTADAIGFSTHITPEQKAQLMSRAFAIAPALTQVLRTWCGLRPRALRGVPYLGRVGSLIVAAGQHRNGILFAPLVARCVEALVCGEAPPVDLQPFAIADSSTNSGKWSESSLHG